MWCTYLLDYLRRGLPNVGTLVLSAFKYACWRVTPAAARIPDQSPALRPSGTWSGEVRTWDSPGSMAWARDGKLIANANARARTGCFIGKQIRRLEAAAGSQVLRIWRNKDADRASGWTVDASSPAFEGVFVWTQNALEGRTTYPKTADVPPPRPLSWAGKVGGVPSEQ
jgi:hypothetical protein